MLQLNPRAYHTIVRQLADPLDTATYYVRAYIRKSYGETLLDTVNLTDQSGQRFTYNYQLPADPSGEGLEIDITTRVFTDSGYTSESDVYIRESELFLIKETWNRVYGGGGGMVQIDYKRLEKIIEDKIKDIQPVKIPPFKEIDLKPLQEAIEGIEVSPIVKTEKIEIGGLIRAVERVRMLLEDLPSKFPPQKEVNLGQVYEGFGNLALLIQQIIEKNKELTENTKKELQETLKKTINKFADVKFTISGISPLKQEMPKKKKDGKAWRKYY